MKAVLQLTTPKEKITFFKLFKIFKKFLTLSSKIGPKHSLVGDTKNAVNTITSVINKFCEKKRLKVKLLR